MRQFHAPMAEDRDQLLDDYRESRAKLLNAIDGLTDRQLSEPTLDGWAVKDHLFHLAFWDDLRADDVERISAGFESVYKMTDEQNETHNEIAHDLRRSLSAAQARWELERSRHRLLDAIQAADDRALEPSHYGAAGLRTDHEDEHAGWLQRWRADQGL
jgi:Mycothiol maleylpyruvate isomerase N-terminal domain